VPSVDINNAAKEAAIRAGAVGIRRFRRASLLAKGTAVTIHSLRSRAFNIRHIAVGALLCGFGIYGIATSYGARDDDTAVAESLAAMLRSGRTVISRHQAQINDSAVGDKGLDGKSVLAEAVRIYQETTGVDPLTIDPASRQGRLLHAQMDAIAEVMDSNRDMLDKKGVGFKGFIPATFGRLVNEAFSKRASNEAEVKVTAPPDLVRNRKARPDAWETEVISAQLLSASWPKGQVYSAVADNKGRQAFRIAVPEYYAASCLSCHGGPKGEIDLTGYPKEGRNEGDLGGVISITLYR
jgi:Protein of unknown function (DUF3365)